MICGIQSALVPQFLPRLLPFFENFAERSQSRWTVEDIVSDVMARNLQVWVSSGFRSVALTRVYSEAVAIVACAGEGREEWCDDLEAEIRAWAKSLGKTQLLITGRPGWSKWLREKGYREAHREMVVSL